MQAQLLFYGFSSLSAGVIALLLFRKTPTILRQLHHSVARAQAKAILGDGNDSDREESEPPLAVSKESDYPTGYWTGDNIFALERRAKLSQTWLYATHRSRFRKPGDYLTREVVGFRFFLILGKDGVLRAFHNVCRHRAYDVTRKPSGSSLVLGCKYHGWSYDTRGNLVKAPAFDGIEGFDKSKNGLWEIRTQVDRSGLVYVNFNASIELPKIGLPPVTAPGKVKMLADSSFVDEWEVKGNFNWKIAARSCKVDTPLPPLAQKLVTSFLTNLVDAMLNRTRHGDVDQVLLPPLSSIHVIPRTSFWLSLNVRPHSSSRSTLTCELYSNHSKPNPVTDQTIIDAAKQNISIMLAAMEEEYAALKAVEEGADSAILDQIMAPIRSEAAQECILAELKEHLRLELVAGKVIVPYAHQPAPSNACAQAALDLCDELDRRDSCAANVGPLKAGEKEDSLSW